MLKYLQDLLKEDFFINANIVGNKLIYSQKNKSFEVYFLSEKDVFEIVIFKNNNKNKFQNYAILQNYESIREYLQFNFLEVK